MTFIPESEKATEMLKRVESLIFPFSWSISARQAQKSLVLGFPLFQLFWRQNPEVPSLHTPQNQCNPHISVGKLPLSNSPLQNHSWALRGRTGPRNPSPPQGNEIHLGSLQERLGPGWAQQQGQAGGESALLDICEREKHQQGSEGWQHSPTSPEIPAAGKGRESHPHSPRSLLPPRLNSAFSPRTKSRFPLTPGTAIPNYPKIPSVPSPPVPAHPAPPDFQVGCP